MPTDAQDNTQAAQPDQPRELFGQIAVRKGFITEEQLQDALDRQQHGDTHKLLGLVMVEMGALSNAQLIEILKYIEAKSGDEVE